MALTARVAAISGKGPAAVSRGRGALSSARESAGIGIDGLVAEVWVAPWRARPSKPWGCGSRPPAAAVTPAINAHRSPPANAPLFQRRFWGFLCADPPGGLQGCESCGQTLHYPAAGYWAGDVAGRPREQFGGVVRGGWAAAVGRYRGPPGVLPPLPRKPIFTLREPVIESPCESQMRTVTFNLARCRPLRRPVFRVRAKRTLPCTRL
jgi:hypothetical protein